MGLTVQGGENLSGKLVQIGEKATSNALREMRLKGGMIQEEARANAPVDSGALENAIQMEEVKLGRERTQILIVVKDGVGTDARGRTAPNAYALEMHEGVYSLGPKSIAKALANGHQVGRKYLERAFKTVEPLVRLSIIEAIREILR